MRAHIRFACQTLRQIYGSEMIKKDKRPDHAPLGIRQHASNLESAQVSTPGLDHHFDQDLAPAQGWLPEHYTLLYSSAGKPADRLDLRPFGSGGYRWHPLLMSAARPHHRHDHSSHAHEQD